MTEVKYMPQYVCLMSYIHYFIITLLHIIMGALSNALLTPHYTSNIWTRRHLSCVDCLEDKREDYQNCCTVYHKYCTQLYAHTYEQFLQVY